MGRGKKWLDSELNCLAEAWIQASEDPVHGTDMSSDTLYSIIKVNYDTLISKLDRSGVLENRSDAELERPIAALRSSWRSLNKQINEIESCFNKAEAARGSGDNDRDVERAMHSLIIGADCDCEEDLPCLFFLRDTWRLLRDHDKWKGHRDGISSDKLKRKADDHENERPIGNKIAKKMLLESSQKTHERDDRLLEIGRALDQKNSILRESYYLSLFSNPALDQHLAKAGLDALAQKAITELKRLKMTPLQRMQRNEP